MGRLSEISKVRGVDGFRAGREARRVMGRNLRDADVSLLDRAGFKAGQHAHVAAGSLAVGGAGGAALANRKKKVEKFDLVEPDLQPVRKSRGVGRREKTDGMTSRATVVRTPTLRDINGKFAGQGQGVKVFHPSGVKRGAVHSTGVFRATKQGVSKADEPRKGMLAPVELSHMQPHTGARVGRKLTL